ncbi:MAG: hypothetical protein ACI4Q3_05725 [Kiritimatiellia bacterium]
MELTDEQKNLVAQWFAQGATLDEIQKRLRAECGIHMTYLDLRLLVAELPQPAEEEPPAAPAPAAPADPARDETDRNPPAAASAPPVDGDAAADAPEAGADKTVPQVTVTVDALMIPGTMASGDVTFTDGTSGKWYLDPQGRLGLGDFPQGYMPSQPDQIVFRQRLMEALQSRGLC